MKTIKSRVRIFRKSLFFTLMLCFLLSCNKDDNEKASLNINGVNEKDQNKQTQMLKDLLDKFEEERLGLIEREKVIMAYFEWNEDENSMVMTNIKEENCFPIGIFLDHEKGENYETLMKSVVPKSRTIYCYSKKDHSLLWKETCRNEWQCYSVVQKCLLEGCASNKCPVKSKVVVYNPLNNSIYLFPETEESIKIKKELYDSENNKINRFLLRNKTLVDEEFFHTISNTEFGLDEDDAIHIDYEWNKKENSITVLKSKLLDGFLTTSNGRKFVNRKVVPKIANVDCHDKDGKLLWSKTCKTDWACYNLVKKCEKDKDNCWEICNLSMIYIPSTRTFYLN